MRELTLSEFEAAIARAASPGGGPVRGDPEAIVVLLVPRGSPFEAYWVAIAPAVAASRGRVDAVRIDTTAEPDAPRRFGLTGAPGLVLFVEGKQVAALAVPWLAAFGAAMGPLVGEAIRGLAQALRAALPPPREAPSPPPLLPPPGESAGAG